MSGIATLRFAICMLIAVTLSCSVSRPDQEDQFLGTIIHNDTERSDPPRKRSQRQW